MSWESLYLVTTLFWTATLLSPVSGKERTEPAPSLSIAVACKYCFGAFMLSSLSTGWALTGWTAEPDQSADPDLSCLPTAWQRLIYSQWCQETGASLRGTLAAMITAKGWKQKRKEAANLNLISLCNQLWLLRNIWGSFEG